MHLPAALPLDMQRNQSGACYMDADPKRGTLVRIPDSPILKVGLGGMVIRRPLRAAFFSLIWASLPTLFFFPHIPPLLVVSCCHFSSFFAGNIEIFVFFFFNI